MGNFMGNFTNEMSRLADEIRTMNVARDNFIKGVQNAVKQQADKTRQFITNFSNDMNDAHEKIFCTKNSFGGKTSCKKKTVQEMLSRCNLKEGLPKNLKNRFLYIA